MDALRLELAALKADLLKQAAATAAADAMKKSAVEEELRKEIALLRAASASEGPVAQHMVREALYRREPYKAVLDRQREKLKSYAAGLEDDPNARHSFQRVRGCGAERRA